MDSVCVELKAAELIVDELLTELDALCELTRQDGRLDSILNKVLLSFSKTPYIKILEQRKGNLKKTSKKMENPIQSQKSSKNSSTTY